MWGQHEEGWGPVWAEGPRGTLGFVPFALPRSDPPGHGALRRRTGTERTWTGAELDISSSWTAYTSPAIHRGCALINKA